MNGLIDFAMQRTRTTLIVLAMILVAGVFARISIPVEADPPVDLPLIFVSIAHEGISPEDAERLLIMPVETELRSVTGIRELTAYAAEGYGNLVVEFEPTHDLHQAGLDVRHAVDRAKPKLPSSAEEPVISERTADDFPVLQVNLHGQVGERVLHDAARRLKSELERVSGVLRVESAGQREEVLEALIDPTLLESYGISAEQLINTVARNNRLIAAGALEAEEGRFSVTVPSVIEEARDVYDIPVKTNADAVVTLREVADIRRGFKDRTEYARVNGEPTVTLTIVKRPEAHVIDLSGRVKIEVERMLERLPAALRVSYTIEQAPFAQRQVTELQGNILTALALVMVLVVAALGLRSGVIVGGAIPVSFLFSLALVYAIGYSFNFMVMFGMLLGLGMLIDGAIVVTEYADRKMAEGFDRRAAFTLAAKRMFLPVTASIATTLAAFLPLMFWPGVTGEFVRYLPVTVFTVLVGSLIYALIFGPVLGSLMGRRREAGAPVARGLSRLEDGDPTRMSNLTGLYARMLVGATRYAPLTVLATFALLVATFMLYGKFGQGMIFLHQAEAIYATVQVKARGNLGAEQANRLVWEVEREILEIPGIMSVNAATRLRAGGRDAQDVIGQFFLELHQESERELTATEIFERIRERSAPLAGIAVEIRELEAGPPVGRPIQIELRSRERARIEPAVREIREHMAQALSGLRDIEDTLPLPGLEWRMQVDRAQAALFDADVAMVGMGVQLVTNGLKIAEYRPDDADEEVDIRLRFPPEQRGIAALERLRVASARGQVPVSSFVSLEPSPQIGTLHRVDAMPVHHIRADVAPGVLADTKVRELQRWIASRDWDPELSIRFRGAEEEQQASIEFLAMAFLMALLLMFMVLVTQFNSLYQSLLILLAVVMSTAGVLAGLMILQAPFSAMLTGVGIVALAGIVVNNNIVFIDTYNHLRRERPELGPIQHIVRAGAQRLRPVLLTTATTILGLLPMASNYSVDLINRTVIHGGQISAFWVPLAQAVVFGLGFASLLTLIATPAMLALPHQIKRLRRPWKGSVQPGSYA